MAERWVVGSDRSRQRLDLFLVSIQAGPSRATIQKAVSTGLTKVNGRTAKASHLVGPGDIIEFTMPALIPLALQAEEIPLTILYEDGDLLVVDKPRGLAVHPAAGNRRGTLVNALLAHCFHLSGIGGVERPGIVHRLDKDTTGLLVVAKNDLAHLGLSAQFKERAVTRTYAALVHGAMPTANGRVEMPIGRHPLNRKRMAIIARGRPALTSYHVLEALDEYSLLRLNLQTGRTHQIRVHLAAIGHPVVGDRTYGRRHESLSLSGQALHAGKLSFRHPRSGELLTFQSDPPADFLAALARVRLEAGMAPGAPIAL